MVPGIWLEAEVMGIECPLADKFPDECFFIRHGKRVIDHGRYQLDFRHPKTREFVMSIFDRLVGEYGVGYIKTDYNIEGGVGTEVNSDSFGDGLLGHNRAYLSLIDEIRAKYPDLIIEGCSSGGLRMDYAHLQKHHLLSVSDQEEWDNTAYVAAAVPTGVLPEQSAVWSYPKKQNTNAQVAFNMVNSMLQRMNLSGEITQLNEEQFKLVKKGVEVYKSIRQNIRKAVPFYPCGLSKYGDGWLCLGLKGDDEQYISVWRMDGEEDEIIIPAQYNEAEILYPCHMGAKIDSRNGGIKIFLPEKYNAVLVKLK